jgi:hypothetical protein
VTIGCRISPHQLAVSGESQLAAGNILICRDEGGPGADIVRAELAHLRAGASPSNRETSRSYSALGAHRPAALAYAT